MKLSEHDLREIKKLIIFKEIIKNSLKTIDKQKKK